MEQTSVALLDCLQSRKRSLFLTGFLKRKKISVVRIMHYRVFMCISVHLGLNILDGKYVRNNLFFVQLVQVSLVRCKIVTLVRYAALSGILSLAREYIPVQIPHTLFYFFHTKSFQCRANFTRVYDRVSKCCTHSGIQ